ncbi:MAG TPA: response regulator transcription factor [Vicinamibacterales bacterium]|jgi:DNA-binding NarL/FixJ family response regulator
MRRLLLVDDHPLVREGIRRVLNDALPDIQIGETESGEAALTELASTPCDLVLLDITLPGLDGLDILKKMRSGHPDVPVLIVSMHPAEQFAQRTIAAGACGYVSKDSDPAEFVEAVAGALKGRRYMPRDRGADGRDTPPHARLSDREYQVLRLLATGRTVSQIAATLSLSVKTISTYRTRILEKMGMSTTAELMHYGIKNDLGS